MQMLRMFLRSRGAVFIFCHVVAAKEKNISARRDQRQPCQPLQPVLVLASAVRVTGCNDQQKKNRTEARACQHEARQSGQSMFLSHSLMEYL